MSWQLNKNNEFDKTFTEWKNEQNEEITYYKEKKINTKKSYSEEIEKLKNEIERLKSNCDVDLKICDSQIASRRNPTKEQFERKKKEMKIRCLEAEESMNKRF